MICICKIVICDLHLSRDCFFLFEACEDNFSPKVCSHIKIDPRCDVLRNCSSSSIAGREDSGLVAKSLHDLNTTVLLHNRVVTLPPPSASPIHFITKLDVIVTLLTCNKDPHLCTWQTSPLTFSQSVQVCDKFNAALICPSATLKLKEIARLYALSRGYREVQERRLTSATSFSFNLGRP